jgi:hypothetical protein
MKQTCNIAKAVLKFTEDQICLIEKELYQGHILFLNNELVPKKYV